LPQVLPATLSATTARLQQVTEGSNASASAAAAKDSAHSSFADIYGTAVMPQSTLLAAVVLDSCADLLNLPETFRQPMVTPAAAAPAVELAVAAFKHTDSQLKRRQQQQLQNSEAVMRVLVAAGEAALNAVQGILATPDLLPFSKTSNANLAIATLAIAVSTVTTVHHTSLQSLTYSQAQRQ
jgi:hypothetical protein